MTLSLLVLDRTGSGIGVAGVVAAEIAPGLLPAPPAGVLVDRLSRSLCRVRFHDLRHGTATLLLASGVHSKIVMRRS